MEFNLHSLHGIAVLDEAGLPVLPYFFNKTHNLRWRVIHSTINYLPYIKRLILLVVQLLTAKLDIQVIQVLYGKYYLCSMPSPKNSILRIYG